MKTHTPHTPAPALAERTFFVMPASIRIHDVDPVCILDGDGDTLATVNAPNKTKWHDPQAVATRIVACANACAGLSDPAAQIKALRDALSDCADELETVCKRVAHEVQSAGGSDMLAAWLGDGQKQLAQARAALSAFGGEAGK